MEKQIYCGINPLKPNQRHPSMAEAVHMNQVRYYGLHQIDSRAIQHNKSIPRSAKVKTRDQLALAELRLHEKIKALRRNLSNEEIPSKKKRIETSIKNMIKKHDEINNLYSIANKEREANKQKNKVLKEVSKPEKLLINDAPIKIEKGSDAMKQKMAFLRSKRVKSKEPVMESKETRINNIYEEGNKIYDLEKPTLKRQRAEGGNFLGDLKKIGKQMGKPYQKTVGVNPFTMGYKLGHDVIGPALKKSLKK